MSGGGWEDEDPDMSDQMYDALLDAAAEGLEDATMDARADLERWAEQVASELRALEAEANRLPAAAQAAVVRARVLLDAVDPGERPEWDVGEWGHRLVFWATESAYEEAELELARARVAKDADPGPAVLLPEWDEVVQTQPALFVLPRPEPSGLSSSDARHSLKPSVRARVAMRARRRCEICGRSDEEVGAPLHFGHVLSLEDGVRLGIGADRLNSEDNLLYECRDCNLGHGGESLALWLMVAVLVARGRRR